MHRAQQASTALIRMISLTRFYNTYMGQFQLNLAASAVRWHTLLQVPGDPKMMIAPIKEKELAAFSLTSLERAPVRTLCLQPDLGIPLSYLDMGVYAVPAHPQPLAPEDEALVEVRCKQLLGQACRHL